MSNDAWWVPPAVQEAGPPPPDLTLTRVVAGAFVVVAMTCGWTVVALCQRAAALDGGVPRLVTSGHLGAVDSRVTAGAGLFALCSLVLLVLFIIWLHAAAVRVRWQRPDGLRRGPGWAIGGWFVPLGNSVLPKQMVDDVWHGAVPTGKPRESAMLVHVWWGALVAGWVLRLVGTTVESGSRPRASDVVTGDEVTAAAFVLLTVAALAGAALVIKARSRFDRVGPDEADAGYAGSGANPSRLVMVGAAALVVLTGGIAVASGPTLPAFAPAPRAAAPTTADVDDTVPTAHEPVHAAHVVWSRMLPSAPAGWTSSGRDVPLSLLRLSRAFAQPAAIRSDLVALGYRRGVDREFYLPSPRRVVDVELWQFGTATGAGTFLHVWLRGNAPAANHAWSRAFRLRTGHQAQALVGASADKYGFRYDVGVARVGDMIVHVRFASLDVPSRAMVTRMMSRVLAPVVRTAR